MLLLFFTACLSGGKADSADTNADTSADTGPCVEWCPVAVVEAGAECLTTPDCAPVCLPPGFVPDMSTCLYMVAP